MKLQMRYFTFYRDLAKTSQEVIEGEVATAEELYDLLRQKHDFPANHAHLRVAINGEFALMSTKLSDNDVVAFIPPVSGG